MASFSDHIRLPFGLNSASKEQKYSPVEENEAEKENGLPPKEKNYSRETILRLSLFANVIGALFGIALTVMVFRQGFRTAAHHHSHPKGSLMMTQMLDDQYALPGKVPVTYELLQHGLDEDDFQEGNKYWADLFPKGGGLVLLDDETVETMRLPPALRVPTVGNKSVYYMAGYHSLHCLTSTRATIAGLLKANKLRVPYIMNDDGWQHLKHCLADARESLLCNMDETLLVVPANKQHPGDGQTKLCKQLGPINQWLEENYHDFQL